MEGKSNCFRPIHEQDGRVQYVIYRKHADLKSTSETAVGLIFEL